MKKPSNNYWLNVNLVATLMVLALIVVAVIGASNGFAAFLIGIVLWVAYFGIGWLLDGFHTRMFRQYEEGLEKPMYMREPLESDRTAPFLMWPVYLIFTGIYIPLVLVLRRMFRADSN